MSAERRTSNGRRWPRRKARPDRWSTFRYLVLREAVFTMGSHQFLTDRNVAFRVQLRDMSDVEVCALGSKIIESWPARKIRP